MTHLLLWPPHNLSYKRAYDLPLNRIHRLCWVVVNRVNKQSIAGDRRYLVPFGRLELVGCQDHKMNTLCRIACMTSRMGMRKTEPKWFFNIFNTNINSIQFKFSTCLWFTFKFKFLWCTYLKKSSLQNNWPFRMKHFSLSCAWQSLHWRHFACHVWSETFKMNRSNIYSWHPPHFGIEAGKRL